MHKKCRRQTSTTEMPQVLQVRTEILRCWHAIESSKIALGWRAIRAYSFADIARRDIDRPNGLRCSRPFHLSREFYFPRRDALKSNAGWDNWNARAHPPLERYGDMNV